jgi:PTS system nitrogen regulatory IIA component
MQAFDILIPGGVLLGLDLDEKDDVLREIAARLSIVTGLDDRTIRDALTEREDLGTTGVGDGVALPHAWINGAKQVAGLLIRLARPIEWDAADHKPVDVVAGVVGPPDAARGLSALAALTRSLREPEMTAVLRSAADPAAVFAALSRSGTRRDLHGAARPEAL